MNNKEEEPKHNFDLPSCILGTMLWASRFLVFLQLWHSEMSIFNVLLMILFYVINIEFGLCFICCFIKYLPVIIKDPASFITADKKELINNDPDFINFTVGITTIAYLIVYFL